MTLFSVSILKRCGVRLHSRPLGEWRFSLSSGDGPLDPHLYFPPELSSPESQVYELNFPSRRPVVDVKGQDKLRLIIDSGAHSGCMPSDKLHLVSVTNTNPNRRVKVASYRCWRSDPDRPTGVQARQRWYCDSDYNIGRLA